MQPVTQGATSPHKFVLARDSTRYFVKATQENEGRILLWLSGLSLRHVPDIVYPDMLHHNVLVVAFVPGGNLTSKHLDSSLVAEYAQIQRQWQQQGRHKPRTASDVQRSGDYCMACNAKAGEVLDRLTKEGYPFADTAATLYEGLADRMAAIAQDLAQMPLGLLHHDFREENVLVGPPQQICDWGSCYGEGPFLFDLAPFVIHDSELLSCFLRCRVPAANYSSADINRWLFAALALRFLGFLRYFWDLCPGASPADRRTEAFIRYHLDTYELLADTARWHGVR